MICEHCASNNIHWFTPRDAAEQAHVLLCMACHRLTIRRQRGVRSAPRISEFEEAAAA